MPHIETERLLIQVLLTEDAERLARLWTDPDVTRYMGGSRDYTKVLQILEEDTRAEDPPDFDLWPVVEKDTGQVVGHCGILDKEVDGREEHELVYVFLRRSGAEVTPRRQRLRCAPTPSRHCTWGVLSR